MRRSWITTALAIGMISCQGVQTENRVTGERQYVALTPEQEVQVGRQSAPEIIKQMGGLDPSPKVQGLVAQVGAKVVAKSGAAQSGYPFEFRVCADTKVINALALPGGEIFITRGLLDRLQNEAQLAGVLGHEVGHVVGRHSAEHMAKTQMLGLGVGILDALTRDPNQPDQVSGKAQLAAIGAQLYSLKFTRQDELEADALGVRFISESGYDPRAMIGVMEILKSLGGSGQPQWMSTHPDPGNREQVVQGEIAKRFPQGVPATLSKGISPLPLR
jgi:beta-barrel assembly-enhancing protease